MYVSVEPTAGGASFDVDGIFDDEPMCMQTTVPVSAHAWKNGSQYPSVSWTDGRPRNGGISVNATAWPPRAALRRISSPASCESHSWMIGSGIRRPSEPAHHSSNIQSLYALTHRSASSMSLASMNVCPQKRGNVGNDSDASTQLTSMSSRRAFGSKQPGRISSYVIAVILTSSRSNPTAALNRVCGIFLSS